MAEGQSSGPPDVESGGERVARAQRGLDPGGRRRAVVAVGLTGGIGAGKSTALSLFGSVGAITLSADHVVHDLYRDADVRAALGTRFGPGVIDALGEVDRGRVAQAVKGRPEELRWLERLTHPLVADELRRRIESAPAGSVVVCEVPLLFESGLQDLFDLVVSIEASDATRRCRSIHRFGEDMFTELEGLQASGDRRAAGSDLVYHNDGDVEHLREFVESAYSAARSLLEDGP